MIYLKLAFEFFKTGLFSIGGGMATIPFLMELTEKYDWYTMEELSNFIAISESTPGPVGVNMATYAGYNAAGVPGALVATLFLVLPSFIVIMIISSVLNKFRENKYVVNGFYGIRPTVAGLLFVVAFTLIKNVVFPLNGSASDPGMIMIASTNTLLNLTSLIIIGVSFALMQIKPIKKLHPVIWIAIGAVLGIVLKL